MRTTILSLAFFFALCANTFSQQLYYTVKFPDDRAVMSCGGYPDTSDMPVIQHNGNCNFSVGVSVKDEAFNLNSTGGCKKILRTWKLNWWCDYNPNWPGPTVIPNPANTDIGPTVNGDSYNHGFLQYTQIIKVIDNAPPVFLNCPASPVLFCDFTNNDPAQYGNRCEGPIDLNVKVTDVCSKSDITLTYRLYLDLDGNGSMETYRTSSAPDAWPIEKIISGDTVSAKIKVPTGVGLPYGVHKVEWIANDGCGNQSLCKYDFEVRDCKAPTVVCVNGLSVNIMPTGMITLWASDFLIYMNDNCTPTDQLKLAIRKAGAGTGFPAFETSVTFDCNEIGQQFVELWAQDANGNADFCQTYINVQDHFGICSTAGSVTGNISTETLEPVPGAKVLLKSNLQAINQQATGTTDSDGNFNFTSAPGTCNYSITPTLDTLPALGINTLDALLVDWHLSGQELLNSPYRIIAADVDHDGQLTQNDADAISNLIIGASSNFPGNTAWRFVPWNHTFADPQQPLSGTFPEKISTVCPLASNADKHFVAIKTGDLDLSADVNNNASNNADDRSEVYPAVFKAANQRFEAGNEVMVTIQAPELSNWLAFQFTFGADPALLQLLDVTPVLNAKYAIHAAQNQVAVSWHTRTGETEGALPVITLRFLALQSGTLKQALYMDSSVATAEGYNLEREATPAILQVQKFNLPQAMLMPVTPNPSTGPVVASFYLPEPTNVTLTLTDVNGGIVSTHTASFDAGNHQIQMTIGNRLSGMYTLRMATPATVESRHVVVQK
ncbi:MAG: T9SS type A sorting domain-containing protein [Saprospiraceae bacterium]|nr:T9SS type A sorting domain-containing protein [Saprospiraceae bacterium]